MQWEGDGAHEVSISCYPWFLNGACRWVTKQLCGRVERKLKFSPLVAPGAEIFRLCALGDVLGVMKLIDAREASPNDVTYEGVTPLIVSVLELRETTVCSDPLEILS